MKRVPVNEPLLDGNELEYVGRCVKDGWISSGGDFVCRFQNEWAAIWHAQTLSGKGASKVPCS